MCKIKKWMETLTDVVEMTRKEYVLAITTSLLGGIVIGYIFAPRRMKYTTIGTMEVKTEITGMGTKMISRKNGKNRTRKKTWFILIR